MTLREIQSRVAAAIMLPRSSARRIDLTSREAARLIKPSDRLTPLERLKIYNRSYWFRLLNALTDDFPGLEAVFGKRQFQRLAQEYLRNCPSCSFTLRDLGSRLEPWLRAHPDIGGDCALALDMVRLEWAHAVAFDGPQLEALGPQDLVGLKPSLRAGLQPYVSLLELRYPVDELRVLIMASQGVGEATSASAAAKVRRAVHRVSRSKPERIFLAVHRLDSTVYYRRLMLEEFRLLQALRSGRSIATAIRACFAAGSDASGDVPELLKEWFSTWARLGWLSAPPGGREGESSS
jgi:hypothetical protein